MFVTFEGTEGAGKSAILHRLQEEQGSERWQSSGFPEAIFTREPGSGELGPQIRKLLLESESLDSSAELYLFLADRASHVATVIRPALAEGKLVLCDRHADSTIVYQGYGRGIDLDFLRQANSIATHGLKPDKTILFDLDPKIGLSRIQSKDRLDREPLEFHQKIRDGFLKEAEREPNRWVKLDASVSLDELYQAAWAALHSAAYPDK